jgi:CSLREA domain-containing protein
MTQLRANISRVSKMALAAGMLVAALMAGLAATPPPAQAETTFTVNSTLDFSDLNTSDGICDEDPGIAQVCTLRAAIEQANTTSGADIINFNITGSGVQTITPSVPLPLIFSPVTIDGHTQPGASPNTLAKGTNAKLTVELNGTNAGSFTDGLQIARVASGTTVRGW